MGTLPQTQTLHPHFDVPHLDKTRAPLQGPGGVYPNLPGPLRDPTTPPVDFSTSTKCRTPPPSAPFPGDGVIYVGSFLFPPQGPLNGAPIVSSVPRVGDVTLFSGTLN